MEISIQDVDNEILFKIGGYLSIKDRHNFLSAIQPSLRFDLFRTEHIRLHYNDLPRLYKAFPENRNNDSYIFNKITINFDNIEFIHHQVNSMLYEMQYELPEFKLKNKVAHALSLWTVHYQWLIFKPIARLLNRKILHNILWISGRYISRYLDDYDRENFSEAADEALSITDLYNINSIKIENCGNISKSIYINLNGSYTDITPEDVESVIEICKNNSRIEGFQLYSEHDWQMIQECFIFNQNHPYAFQQSSLDTVNAVIQNQKKVDDAILKRDAQLAQPRHQLDDLDVYLKARTFAILQANRNIYLLYNRASLS